MKKVILIIAGLLIAAVLVSCASSSDSNVQTTSSENVTDTATETTNVPRRNPRQLRLLRPFPIPKPFPPRNMSPIPKKTVDAWVEENRVIPDVIPEFVQGDMVIYSPENARCKESYLIDYLPTYGDLYYEYADFLSDEVGKDAFNEWYIYHYRSSIESGVEFEEMPLVNFIKEFHITRDVFEKAYAEKKQAMIDAGVYTNLENPELPNADIIYTFVNEIINNYYRRALRRGSRIRLTPGGRYAVAFFKLSLSGARYNLSNSQKTDKCGIFVDTALVIVLY